MATIRITAGADYDPNNYGTADISSVDGNASDNYTLGIEYIGGVGNIFSLRNDTSQSGTSLNVSGGPAATPNDGIYADLSDKTGNVSLTGGDRGDVLRGGSGNDTLNGGGGDDTLNGGGGNDVLEGGFGSNIIIGGTGVNTISYEHYSSSFISTEGVIVELGNGFASDRYAIGNLQDSFTDIQNVRGSAQRDFLFGDSGRNVIEGGGGADIINGNGGANSSSSIRAAISATDFASYLHSADAVTVNLTTGINTGGDARV